VGYGLIKRFAVGLVDIDDGRIPDARCCLPPRLPPIGEELRVSHFGIRPWAGDEVACIDSLAGAKFERRRIARLEPERRMRTLGGNDAVGEIMLAAPQTGEQRLPFKFYI
jgi:hypothetical protein